ncbi:MAG: hypothetical protein ACLGH3_10115 [Actinomycetota bacterium]
MRKLITTALAVSLMAGIALAPTAANADPGVAVFTGTAGTSPLWYPGAGPDAAGGSWSFTSTSGTCTGTHCEIGGSGSFTSPSYCASSGGLGTGSHSISDSDITWVRSAGGVLPIVVLGGHIGAALVVAAPTPAPPGQVTCLTVPATSFEIVGVGAVV